MIETVIDLKSLEFNYSFVKGLLKDSSLMPVIKSNAYGHGIREVASRLYTLGERFFVISSKDDYIKVADFKADFLLLYYDPEDRSTINSMNERGNVIFNLYDSSVIEVLPKGARVHIEMDTGMNRTGIKPYEFEDVYKNASKRLRVEGVFTHFPMANDEEFSRKQLEIFDELTKGLDVKRHVNNSLGLLKFGPLYDSSRVGILLYGYGAKNLKPVKRVYSKILQVKRVKRGETVSYDGIFVCEDGFVGIVPVGYAHGLRRVKDTKVFVNGKFFDIAGWITMDAFMIFSKDEEFKVGDRVELLGENITADTLSDAWKTITYEVLVSFPSRP